MFATPAQFTEIQKGQMDAAIALSQTWFDAAERLMELNLPPPKPRWKNRSSARKPCCRSETCKNYSPCRAA